MRLHLTLILIALFCSCEPRGKKKIRTQEVPESNTVIFDTRVAKFHLDKDEVVDYINSELISKEWLAKQLEDIEEDPLLVLDSFVTNLDTIVDMNPTEGGFKKLARVPDWSVQQTQFADAVRWATVSLVCDGKASVFDKRNDKFVETVTVDYVTDDIHSRVDIYLPNDTLVMSALKWIK